MNIGWIIWAGAVFALLAWVLCKAGGDADDDAGYPRG